MRTASDLRKSARNALNGNWKLAVLTGLLVAVLGAVENFGPNVSVNINGSQLQASFQYAGKTIFSTANGISPHITPLFVDGFTYIVILGLMIAIGVFILGSIVSVGYAKFNLNLVDQSEYSLKNLFAYFSYWKTTLLAKILQLFFIMLWSLLFIIPGFIAYFRYAMTEFILAENPDLSANEAIDISKKIMQGNKLRLFCLELSFIGWELLCVLTLGIGNLWLTPYKRAAIAAFYRDLSNN